MKKTSNRIILLPFPSRMKKKYWFLLVLVAILLTAAGSYFYFRQPAYELVYDIRIIAKETVEVNLLVKNIHLKNNQPFELFKGNIPAFDPICTDTSGKKLSYTDKDGIISISPGNSKSILFGYTVGIGNAGKHGFAGQTLNDLVVFGGEQVLMFPPLALTGTDTDIKKEIARVDVNFLGVPSNMVPVIPFLSGRSPDGSIASASISSPSWSDIYTLAKSSYTFSDFVEHTYSNSKGKLTTYIDSSCKEIYTDETSKGIAALYDYYCNTFGYSVPNLSLVILRKDPSNGSYIMGGVSTQTLSATFDPTNPRDWELLSHRFFHAFFDTQVITKEIHFPPQTWLYEGLATYYENMGIDSLPESIKTNLGLSSSKGILSLYKRYVYMRLKDPKTLSLIPADEEDIVMNSSGKSEFLHYTQSPLLVKYLEDVSYSKYKTHDRMLKYLLQNCTNQTLTPDSIIQYTIGDESKSFLEKYVYGNELLPLWDLAANIPEDQNSVLQTLNDFEYLLWTWFRLENNDYMIDKLMVSNLDTLTKKAEVAGVHFADEDTELKVKNLSPTVYQFLKQYALRAKVCGVDYNDPDLRMKLLGDKDNARKWEEAIK